MILWGTKGREKVVSEGMFFCPTCNTTRPYKRKSAARYFTLYFIPLFKTKKLGEFVECQVCKSAFDPKILEAGSQGTLKMVATTRYSLLHGTPPSAARSQLINSGIDAQIADRIIEMAQR